MNNYNLTKVLGLMIIFLSFQSVGFAQSNSSRMDRQKSFEKSADPGDSQASNGQYAFSIAHVTVKNGSITVKMEERTTAPTTEAEKLGEEMIRKSTHDMRNAVAELKTETDLLAYLASRGMELIAVLPEGSPDSGKKIYYLRSRID